MLFRLPSCYALCSVLCISHNTHSCFRFSEPALCRYLGKGVHSDAILLVIPSVSKKVIENYDDSLKYIIKKMDKYVATRFSLIVCQTCVYWTDSKSYYFVNFWYSMLPRNFKRNLHKVYLVHPYAAARTLLTYSFGYSNVECVDMIGPLLTKLGLTKAGMLKQFPYVVQRMEEVLLGISTPISPFTELPVLSMRTGHTYKSFPNIPPILSKLLDTIEQHVDIPHLLYLQCPVDALHNTVNEVERIGEFYEYETPAEAVAMLNLILNSQVGGLLGPKAYITVKNSVMQSIGNEDILNSIQNLTNKLPSVQKDYIWCIIKTLRAIARKSGKNGHSVKKISKIYASTFFRPLSNDRDVAKVIPACEYILASMIEKPESFFKKEGSSSKKEPYARLVSGQVKSSSSTKSAASSDKHSSAASTPIRTSGTKEVKHDSLVHTSSASSQEGTTLYGPKDSIKTLKEKSANSGEKRLGSKDQKDKESGRYNKSRNSSRSELSSKKEKRPVYDDESPIVKESRSSYKDEDMDAPISRLSREFAETLKLQKTPSFIGLCDQDLLPNELGGGRTVTRKVTKQLLDDLFARVE
ncbi:conserved hypothetical protein [Theileria equi strain WA]|uniref:Rho-GAP domain-containing protein n=1 Tax=Theileria equi strain WA TaxID=1537102 RepID=L1LAK9_THEEQ|nr:conserved hypothetical protein [Theileria equi strain WA]EKX72198.1 conserved hypothetical protein [Theileria equi strain WA]|eukprot:XP_004831650.1 conserved hypothetical protein [Theileria equi strain WA]